MKLRYPRVMSHFPADLYSLLHRGHDGDVEFYTRACAGLSAVLELGCGDGRITCPLAEFYPMLSVLGIDDNPSMISRAKRRAEQLPPRTRSNLRFEVSDMMRLNATAAFDAILMPFTTFFCIPADARANFLQRILMALKPGGRFLFDGYITNISDLDDADEFSPLTTVYQGDAPIHIFEKYQVDPIAQVIHVTYAHTQSACLDDHAVRYTIQHHVADPEVLIRRLGDLGFVHTRRWGGFDGAPPTPADELFILSTQKPD
ncbi:MAG: class I SAM-dependent methyltransferase [Myxococcota bacterium]|nr:class I SAM-dependent methyltransferase [Myxococcota bacterium]